MLTNSNSLLSISQITNKLQITKRTAYSAINGLNEWLELHDLNKIMTVRNHGYFVQPYEISEIEKNLKHDLQQGKVKLPQSVRVIAIEFAILCRKNRVTIEYLNSLNGVTRRTTQSDLAKVKKDTESRNLKLELEESGYLITGLEEEIRKFALQKLANIQGTMIFDKIAPFLSLETKEKVEIEQVLLTVEQNIGCLLTDESVFQVKEYICFSVKRYRNGHFLKNNRIKKIKGSGKFEPLIRNLLSYLGISAEHLNAESQLLCKIIDSRQISKISKNFESQEMSNIAAQIIKRFSVISGIDLVNNKSLQNALTTHLVAAQRRVLYNVQFLNSSLLSIRKKYPEIYLLTKEAVQPFEQYLKKSLTADEIELIAVYFGGEIELLKNAKSQSPKEQITLVCGSGIGTSRLLKIQLEKMFPDQLKIKVITKQDYEKQTRTHADLVIATLPVTNKGAPIVNINHILTDYDLQTIRQHLASKAQTSSSVHNSPAVKTTQILDIVSEYAHVKDFTGLTAALQSYFSQKNVPFKKEQSHLPCLSEILPERRIAFENGTYSWQESVKVTGKLLEKDHIADEKYTRKMCMQIEKYGPYMKIMDNVMLLHAKPDNPTKYSVPGMSLVCFTPPVKFSNNIKAKYVFSLYAPNSNSQLKALTQLTEIFSNRSLLEKFEHAENAPTFIKLFDSVEKGDEKLSDTTNRSEIDSIEC